MKNIYRPFNQLPYCCVPATLQSVLYRHGLDIMDQEEIGAQLGLRVPEKFTKFFSSHTVLKLSAKSSEYGTQIFNKKYYIQNFFNNNNLPLNISNQKKIYNKKELKNFLNKNFKTKNDIIIRFNNKIFENHHDSFQGHFGLVEDVVTDKEILYILDPEPPFHKKITYQEALYAISDKIDGITRGFFVINKKD